MNGRASRGRGHRHGDGGGDDRHAIGPRGGSQRRALSSVAWWWRSRPRLRPTPAHGGEPPRALTALGAVGAATNMIERIGAATGVPFGRYEYTDACDRRSAGCPRSCRWPGSPWRYPPRGRRAALGPRSAGIARRSSAPPRSPRGTCFSIRRWSARATGGGRDLARTAASRLGNYVGWFVTGLGVMAIIERALPVTDPVDAASSTER